MATTQVRTTARKTRKVGPPPSKTGVIAIPIKGYGAHFGTMVYMAVLAYPNRSQWEKRDRLVEASKAYVLKDWIAQGGDKKKVKRKYRSYRNDLMEKSFRAAVKRINRRRIPAAIAAQWMMASKFQFNLEHARQATQEMEPEQQVRHVAAAVFVNRLLRSAPANVRQAMQQFVGILTTRKEDTEDADDDTITEDEAVRNLRVRVWKESLPVLHLAIPLAGRWQKLCKERQSMAVAFLYDTSWLESSLTVAENLREHILPENIRGYRPEEAVQLIPESK